MQPRDQFVTPEAVALTIDTAGLGSRSIAAMIDSLIQAACLLALGFIAGAIGSGSSTAGLIVFSIGAFILVWGYYVLFEGLWRGRTPGKRSQGLRVVRLDGQPVTIGPILVRNILRIVDFIPGGYGVGVIAMILSRRSQRIGDMAAGTIVIRERPFPTPVPLVLSSGHAHDLDTASLTQRQYIIVRDFLQRRSSLDPRARAAIATQLADVLRPSIGGGPSDNEMFLEAVVMSFQSRSAGGPAGHL